MNDRKHQAVSPSDVAPGVLMITPCYGVSNDGVAIVAESLVQSLRTEGVRCAVIEVIGDGWVPQVRRGSAGELVIALCVRASHPGRNWTSRIAARFRSVVAGAVIGMLVRRLGLRVSHFHFSLPEYSLLRRLCARYGLRSVATFHGSDLTVNMTCDITRAAIVDLVADCAVVTTVSQSLQNTLLGFFPDVGPISRVIHNSVPTTLSALGSPAARAGATHNRQRDIDVLFVGNLIHRKGVDVLLRAVAMARLPAPISVVIVGDGPERAALESLALDAGVSASVRFVGRQGRDSVVELYQRARLVVVPSRAEPFGVVVVEAQICRAAVIASAVGGIPEIVIDQETGVLVPAEDPVALAGAIEALLGDDRRRNALAARGYERACSDFSPAGIARQYCDVYRTATAGIPS